MGNRKAHGVRRLRRRFGSRPAAAEPCSTGILPVSPTAVPAVVRRTAGNPQGKQPPAVAPYLQEVDQSDRSADNGTMTTGEQTRHRSRRWQHCWRIVLVLALPVLAGCEVRKPIVLFQDIEVLSIEREQAQLVFMLSVTNPNTSQIALKALDYRLQAAGEVFAAGSLPRPIAALNAGETTPIRVPVTIPYRQLAPLFARLRTREAIPYEFSALATFGFLTMPVEIPFSRHGLIPAIEAPAFRLRDVRLAASKAEGQLELLFEVSNPNVFELPQMKLVGALTIDGRPVVRLEEVALGDLPPGKTREVVVPVRLSAEALSEALLRPGRLKFEGSLRLGNPKGLRHLLLSEPGE